MAVAVRPRRRRRLRLAASSGLFVALRRTRTERAPALALLAVVAVTAGLFAALPRAFNEAADDGLRHALATADPRERNVEVEHATRIPAGPAAAPFANVAAAGEAHASALPDSVAQGIVGRAFAVDTPRFEAVSIPTDPAPGGLFRYLTMRLLPEGEADVQVVAGAPPGESEDVFRIPPGLAEAPPIPGSRPTEAGEEEQRSAPVFEVALSPATAEALAVGVGDRLLLRPYPRDPLLADIPRSEQPYVAAGITALVQIAEGARSLAAERLRRPLIKDTETARFVYAYGFVPAAAYPSLLPATARMPLRYSWRYQVDPSGYDAAGLELLAADLRRVEAATGGPVYGRPEEPDVRTGLLRVLDRYTAERTLAETVLATAALGLLAVALSVVGLLAALAAERRREAVALVRGRGGSLRQVLAADAAEALAVALAAGALGFAVALAVPGQASALSAWLAAAVVAATVTVVVATTAGTARRTSHRGERDEVTTARLSPRRLAVEALAVVLALAGVYLLRRRGLAPAGPAGDPYLAAVPVLLAFAAGVVVVRLYPLPARALARVGARRRDLVPALALARAARQPLVAAMPLLVLLLTAAVAAFASVVLETIAEARTRMAWQTVGADLRVDAAAGRTLPPELHFPAAEAQARAFLATDAELGGEGELTLLALDTPAYERVVAATPAAITFPGDVHGRRPGEPLPAIVSRSLPAGTLRLRVGGDEIAVAVAERRERFPGLPSDRPFAVVPLRALQELLPRRARGNRLYLRAPAGAEEPIKTALRRQEPGATLHSRARAEALVRDAPLAAATGDGFRALAGVSLAYGVLAAALATVLTGRARTRDLAYLRTLGLSRRQALGLAAVELAPPLAVAVAVGVALGVLAAHVVEPGLDLRPFAGTPAAPPLAVDAVATALLAAALAAVVAAAAAAAGAVASRTSLNRVLRMGER